MSREENKITILIPGPAFSWQQQSVSLETNLEACEQCGPGLLISADTGSHYPGLGAKPKTAHANPVKRASEAQARLLVWSRARPLRKPLRLTSGRLRSRLACNCETGTLHSLYSCDFVILVHVRAYSWGHRVASVRTRGVKSQTIVDAFRLRASKPMFSAAKSLYGVALHRNNHFGTFWR